MSARINRLVVTGNDVDTEAEAMIDRYMARVYKEPASVFEYLRKCHRGLWEFLRKATALVVAEEMERPGLLAQKRQRARQRDLRHWRYCGMLCWFTVAAFIWIMPDRIDGYVGVFAVMGALCQHCSTTEGE